MASTLPMSSPAMSSNVLASASLYVGDLSSDVPESMLYKHFNDVGEVSSIRVLRDTHTRRSLGYAYVNFHRFEDAKKALEILNFKPIGGDGRPCRVMWSQRDPQLRKSGKGNIFIKNLPRNMTHENLHDTFKVFGSILSCKVAQTSTGESLNYGFVHFEQEADAKNAVELGNNMMIVDRQVQVAPFLSKHSRGGFGRFTNVYVKNLPRTVAKDGLLQLFQAYGTITSHDLVSFDDEKKTNFGFVNFKSFEEAQKAIDSMNNSSLQGHEQKLVVVRAQKREERQKELKDRFDHQMKARYHGVNLYIKNLSDSITSEKLATLFCCFGQIKSAAVMTDEITGKSKGFGFVCFNTPESAMTAIASKNNTMEDGKPLYVALAQRRADRQAVIQEKLNRLRAIKPPNQGYMYSGYPPMGVHPNMRYMQGWPSQPMGMPMQGISPNQRPHYSLVPSQNAGRGRPSRRGGQNRQVPHVRHHQSQGKFSQGVTSSGPGPRHQGPSHRMHEQQAAAPIADIPSEFVGHVANLPAKDRKIAFGEQLFPRVHASHPELAPKITGMLIEMDDSEILELLMSNEALSKKIAEAILVLEDSAE